MSGSTPDDAMSRLRTNCATPHPVVSIRDLFWPRVIPASRELLENRQLELTYNGRGALLRACAEIAGKGRKQILLPAFHCPSGITPVLRAGLVPVFYRIRRDLSIDYGDLLSKIGQETGAVLVIHYFGFAADLGPLAELGKRGIALIEDWSHSFLRGDPPRLTGGDGDYSVYSFWKLVPSGVGGGLFRKNPPFAVSRRSPPPPFGERVVRLKRMFEEALDHSEHRFARAAFARMERARLALKPRRAAVADAEQPLRGEDRYPFDPRLAASAMPGLARRIIESCDFETVARRRRDNFRRYGELLSNRGPLQVLYPQLPAEACPWVFPVLLAGRDAIDHRWRAAGVALHTFGIYLHSALFETTDERTLDDARFLADHLLCLAIHPDVNEAEIEWAAKFIQTSLASTV